MRVPFWCWCKTETKRNTTTKRNTILGARLKKTHIYIYKYEYIYIYIYLGGVWALEALQKAWQHAEEHALAFEQGGRE